MRNFTLMQRSILFLAALYLLLVSCQRFYLPVATPASTPDDKSKVVKENVNQHKFFILRQSTGEYAMKNIQVDQQAQRLNFEVDTLPEEHQVYIKFRRPFKYKKSLGEQAVLNEVHIFSKGTVALETSKTVSLPLEDIEKIEVIEFDKGRTTVSYVLGAVGGTLGAIAVTGVIIALTKSSCPFVSVYDGQTYAVQGELFGGAIYPSLEREDFVPLKASSIDGEFKIRISNELQEKQYTNFAKLYVITHNKDVKALTDQDGKVYTVARPTPVSKAVLNNHRDVTSLVNAVDVNFFGFDDTTTRDNINSLILKFDRPNNSNEGKLILQLKNSYWFDYLYGEFSKAFGSYYKHWVKKQKKVQASELEKWSLSQHIPLQVSLKTDTGWAEVCHLKTIGPLTNREVLIPLNLQNTKGNVAEVKISTGFMFWELDFAGIDYTPGAAYTIQTLAPYEAEDEQGKNVLSCLQFDDRSYLDQPRPGNAAVLKYRMNQPIDPGQGVSVILHTKGYYEHVRHYSGKPDITFLKGFRQPGAFAAFSRQQFEKVKTQNILAVNR